MQRYPSSYKTVGQALERAREEEGLGLRELARASGVSPGQISRILAGKTSRPSVETLVRLAGALERDVDALLVLAEAPETFSGGRLDAARIRILDAIANLPAVDRRALADEERDLRRQIDEAARVQEAIQRLEVQLVESRASSTTRQTAVEGPEGSAAADDRLGLGDPMNARRVTGDPGSLEEQLRQLQSEREALDEDFAAAIRVAAARLFMDVRGRELTQASTSSPAWHAQPRAAGLETAAPRLSVRPLSDLLSQTPNAPAANARSGLPRERAAERELRHVLRVWEQLNPARRKRVVEFVDDQHRLSLHEQLSQDAKDDQGRIDE